MLDFYSVAVGLPLMREYPGIFMYWGGEATAFELKFDTTAPGHDETDPATAQLVPVFRSHDLAATRARLTAAGHPPVAETTDEHGATFHVLGPDRLLTGFTQRTASSPLAAEAEALARWQAGPPRLPDTGPLAPELQHLSRVVLRAADVAASSAFYAGAYGLDEVGTEGDTRLHTLGDTMLLQIAPGGAPRAVPGNRFEVTGTFLLRTHDLTALTADALVAGARPVGEEIVYDVGVRIRYLADPDGVVTGFIQRTDDGGGEEDSEAMRRWAARETQPA